VESARERGRPLTDLPIGTSATHPSKARRRAARRPSCGCRALPPGQRAPRESPDRADCASTADPATGPTSPDTSATAASRQGRGEGHSGPCVPPHRRSRQVKPGTLVADLAREEDGAADHPHDPGVATDPAGPERERGLRIAGPVGPPRAQPRPLTAVGDRHESRLSLRTT
jgi:hypothetical protein